jgi:hypothetical protein
MPLDVAILPGSSRQAGRQGDLMRDEFDDEEPEERTERRLRAKEMKLTNAISDTLRDLREAHQGRDEAATKVAMIKWCRAELAWAKHIGREVDHWQRQLDKALGVKA